jgi:hypothetical protein
MVDTKNGSVASPATPRGKVSRNGKLPTYYIGADWWLERARDSTVKNCGKTTPTGSNSGFIIWNLS